MHRILRTLRRPSLLLATGLLAACVSSSYSGQQYAPTQQVEVFHDPGAIPAGFVAMGEIRTTASPGMSLQSIEVELVDQARRRGADAIVIDRVQLETIGYRVEPSSSSPEGVSSGADDRIGGAGGEAGTAIREQVVAARLLKRSPER